MKLYSRTLFSLMVFLATLLVYIITLAPGLMFTDSGELAAVCSTMGIAHPTGYPLFTILGYLWTQIPVPVSNIFLLNLFAAFVTAASTAVFFNIIYLLCAYASRGIAKKEDGKKSKKSRNSTAKSIYDFSKKDVLFLSAISALIYSFALTVWAQGTSVEVYCLQILIINLVIYVSLRASLDSTPSKRYYFLAAFLLGLGFSNHMTTVLLVPALLFLFFKRPGGGFSFSRERLKLLLMMIIPFAIGLSFVLYLPLRSAGMPELNWGMVHRSMDKFLYHALGKQYQVWMFTSSEVWKLNFVKFFELLPYQLAWIGLVPLGLGFYRMAKISKTLLAFFVIMILSCMLYSFNYSIHDIDTYFLTAFIGLIIIAGTGLFAFAEHLPKAIPFFFIIPAISLIMNFSDSDNSGNELVPEYTRITTESFQQDAIVISAQWDFWCSAFWYNQQVEGIRKDVVLIEKELLRRTWYPKMLKQWYPEVCEECSREIDSYSEYLELFETDMPYDPAEIQRRFINLLNCFVDKFYGKRPIYITLDVFQTEKEVAKDYAKVPEGFALRLEREKTAFPVSVDNIDIQRFVESLEGREGHLVEGIKNSATFNITNIGQFALYNARDFKTAEEAYRKALEIDPKNPTANHGLQQLLNARR